MAINCGGDMRHLLAGLGSRIQLVPPGPNFLIILAAAAVLHTFIAPIGIAKTYSETYKNEKLVEEKVGKVEVALNKLDEASGEADGVVYNVVTQSAGC